MALGAVLAWMRGSTPPGTKGTPLALVEPPAMGLGLRGTPGLGESAVVPTGVGAGRVRGGTVYACLEVPQVGQEMNGRGQAVAMMVPLGWVRMAGMATRPGFWAGIGSGLSEKIFMWTLRPLGPIF
jgi:hypothetical protein